MASGHQRSEYEYVVVGSGAGGGPVAANLAEAGRTVLLLEAGGADEPYDYQVPAFHAFASEHEQLSWEFFVRHYDDEDQQKRDWKYTQEEKGVFYPRAGTLGGCTAHNAMIFVYPANSDWDAIAELTGDPSWGAENMRRYFERLEGCRYRPVWRWIAKLTGWNPSRHGFAGWLGSEEADPKLAVHDDELLDILKSAAWKAFWSVRDRWGRLKRAFATVGDPNDWRSVRRASGGIRLAPLNTLRGRRASTRERLLAVQRAHPENLEILTGALATRVLFDDDDRATGVEYRLGEHLYRADPRYREDASYRSADPGELRQVTATREVILAGGTFNTPQLLQLSGVGPPELLRRHGIRVRVELPGVGRNLQDRYEVAVVQRMREPFSMLEGATMRPPAPGEEPDPFFVQWRERGEGIYTTNGAVLSIIKRSRPEEPAPDLYVFGLVSDFRGYFPGYSELIRKSHDVFTWAILKGHTTNTAGTVEIGSADPRDVPAIRFRYFEEGNGSAHDLEAVVDAVELVRKMSRRYDDILAEEIQPGAEVKTRDEIRQFVRNQAWGHHASSTCKIGSADDEMAVLDGDFRVRGTQGLRVVDASVFPRIPGLFIVSAVYMIAEKASDVILKDANADAGGDPR